MRSGIFLILLSMSITPFGDALSKDLGAAQSPLTIVFLRYLVAGLVALALAAVTKTPVRVQRKELPGLFLQTALVILAMSCLVLALSMVSLAAAVGAFLIAPIVATLISVVVFGHVLTIPKICGSLLSFVGALLILRPGAEIEIGNLFALAGGLFLGAFLALSFRTPQSGGPVSNLAVQCLLGAGMLAPFAFAGLPGFGLYHLPVIVGLGLVTAATHFLTVAAYRCTTAATLAPFFYFNLIAAVLIGLVWFGEVPTLMTFAGLAAILAGGLISLIRVITPPARIGQVFAVKSPVKSAWLISS